MDIEISHLLPQLKAFIQEALQQQPKQPAFTESELDGLIDKYFGDSKRSPFTVNELFPGEQYFYVSFRMKDDTERGCELSFQVAQYFSRGMARVEIVGENLIITDNSPDDRIYSPAGIHTPLPLKEKIRGLRNEISERKGQPISIPISRPMKLLAIPILSYAKLGFSDEADKLKAIIDYSLSCAMLTQPINVVKDTEEGGR